MKSHNTADWPVRTSTICDISTHIPFEDNKAVQNHLSGLKTIHCNTGIGLLSNLLYVHVIKNFFLCLHIPLGE